MDHPALHSPEALVFAPLVLGYVGIGICIAVMKLAEWIGRDTSERLPGARARTRRVLDRRALTP